jgi:hypothetical protein
MRKPEDHEYHAEKREADLGRRRQEGQLDQHVGSRLRNRQEMIVEPIAEAGFGANREHRRQPQAPHKKARRDDGGNRPRIGVQPQHKIGENVADRLYDQHLATILDPPQQTSCRQRPWRLGLIGDDA